MFARLGPHRTMPFVPVTVYRRITRWHSSAAAGFLQYEPLRALGRHALSGAGRALPESNTRPTRHRFALGGASFEKPQTQQIQSRFATPIPYLVTAQVFAKQEPLDLNSGGIH